MQSSYTTGTRVVKFYGANLTNKIYIVTGGNHGLGLETARVLLFEGHATVIIAVRNIERGNEIVCEWSKLYNLATNGKGLGSIVCERLDLSSLQSVQDFASSFLQSGRILEGLCNNAGIFQLNGCTSDGFQNVWQTNYLSHALLTELILPATSNTFRVVNVSSKLHFMAGDHGPLSLKIPPLKDAGGSYFDYALSKACQVSQTMELERKFAKEKRDTNGLIRKLAFAVEPGLVNTGIMRESSFLVRFLNYLLLTPILKTVEQGAACSIYCLVANIEEGGYFEDCSKKAAATYCNNSEDVKQVDSLFRELVGLI